MTYKFLTDARFGFASNVAADVRPIQEQFVRLIKFFDNSAALGVTRIASNYGLNLSGSSYPSSNPAITLNGQGFGYWDEQLNAGKDAWAVFRFTNADVPFYVLLQWAVRTVAGQEFGIAPGYPASHPETTNAGIGIQIACRSDGTNPWGGSMNNNGFDTKSNPVWTTGSNGMVFVWPRTNSAQGALYNGSRAAHMSLFNASNIDLGTITRSRMTACIDENNIFIASDVRGTLNYDVFYFGKYTPISGTTPPVPYWAFSDGNDPPFSLSAIGSVSILSGSTARDGGIAVSTPAISGTVALASYTLPDPGLFGTTVASYEFHPEGPNTGSINPILSGNMYGGSSHPGVGLLLERPLLLFAVEAANAVGSTYMAGLVGYSYEFLRAVCCAVPPNVTLSGSTRMVIGNNRIDGGTINGKWTIPWTSSLGPMYSANNRNGFEI